jgi:hypothetical protein
MYGFFRVSRGILTLAWTNWRGVEMYDGSSDPGPVKMFS